ncbi:c-type cytochrome biogenesis protein CcmI [Thiocapsa imhoffii]|uniref:C-type cytochrome biogenesis protein CcmI n=1 Tax=Thiocapsa imhoffii TaxID=382777 RepID=A0A9X1BA17_9GAMM|nr:c-type cytochrome biogenesis protein CcmI [Thiocapsa imhoffii]MBK1645621.1 c-type cytochrome biogenesis protein CcmI [Thiocapsa imhoffii]
MIIFWILSAGLIALALVFVALPFFQGRISEDSIEQDELNFEVFKQRMKELDADLASGILEPDQYASAKRDLERDLLSDVGEGAPAKTGPLTTGGRWMALILAVLVPSSAVLIYMEVGRHDVILQVEDMAQGQGRQVFRDVDGQELPPLEVLVERLAERLREDPSNVDGWLMIGRTYFTMQRPEQARDAIARAYALAPERSDVALAYAEAIAANSNNSLEGQPAELIEQVLVSEPDNISARWLSGMVYYQRGQYTAAATAWQRVLAVMDPASDEASDIQDMIREAQARAGTPAPESRDVTPVQSSLTDPNSAAEAALAAAAVPESPSSDQTTEEREDTRAAVMDAGDGGSITADVRLADALRESVMPEDVVFVFARAQSGPPMPLAVQRVKVKDLPIQVRLDDSMAMMPEMSLSAFPQVIVGARISKSGLATPQPGDLEGETGPIEHMTSSEVAVTIDRVRP